MNILYIDTIGGISGDMLVASLLNIIKEDEFLLKNLKKLALNPWQWQHSSKQKGSFAAEKIDFIIEKNQPCRNIKDIEEIIYNAEFSTQVTSKILNVFKALATAESLAHGITEEEVHFHEVGADDTILDIASVMLLLDHMNIEKIYCSPLPMGNGLSKSCHGLMPHPAPALNYLLEGVPIYGIDEKAETVTPTGLAILKSLNCKFGDMPPITISKIGVGCGTKEFSRPNILRCFLGAPNMAEQSIYKLECNVDDMSGEDLGFLWDAIDEAGATDMCYNAIQMKKGRPGQRITILTDESNLISVRNCLFKHTSTIGMTCTKQERFTLERAFKTIATPYGEATIKIATGYGVKKAKPEYNEVRKTALRLNLPTETVRQTILDSYNKEHN